MEQVSQASSPRCQCYRTAKSPIQPWKLAFSSVPTTLKCACTSVPSAEARKKDRTLHSIHSPASLLTHVHLCKQFWCWALCKHVIRLHTSMSLHAGQHAAPGPAPGAAKALQPVQACRQTLCKAWVLTKISRWHALHGCQSEFQPLQVPQSALWQAVVLRLPCRLPCWCLLHDSPAAGGRRCPPRRSACHLPQRAWPPAAPSHLPAPASASTPSRCSSRLHSADVSRLGWPQAAGLGQVWPQALQRLTSRCGSAQRVGRLCCRACACTAAASRQAGKYIPCSGGPGLAIWLQASSVCLGSQPRTRTRHVCSLGCLRAAPSARVRCLGLGRVRCRCTELDRESCTVRGGHTSGCRLMLPQPSQQSSALVWWSVCSEAYLPGTGRSAAS